MLKESINDLNLDALMYSGYLLSKFPQNRMAEALTIAVPIAFEMRMHQEMDPEDLNQLSRLLGFCSSFNVSSKTKTSLIRSLKFRLLKDNRLKDTMPVQEAAELFIKLERAQVREPAILNFIFDIFERRDLREMHPAAVRRLLGR